MSDASSNRERLQIGDDEGRGSGQRAGDDEAGWRQPRVDAIERPHPSRLDPADPRYSACLAAHRAAVAAGEAGYIDPSSGLFVMTAAYLLERGWCCDRGCRHCPWVDDGPGTVWRPGAPNPGDPSSEESEPS